ncbi:MAG: hypothetical protein WA687_12255 [Solirubrobacterales bacterium]
MVEFHAILAIMLKSFLVFVLVGAILVLSLLTVSGCGGSGDADAQNGSSAANGSAETENEAIPPDSEAIAGYTEPTQAYTEVLTDLRDAVLAGKGYKAIRHARGLGPVEKTTVYWFCFTAWQLDVNDEEWRIPNRAHLLDRVTGRVVLDLNGQQYAEVDRAPYMSPVGIAVTELDEIVDFASFDGGQTRLYKKTCYPPPKPAS